MPHLLSPGHYGSCGEATPISLNVYAGWAPSDTGALAT